MVKMMVIAITVVMVVVMVMVVMQAVVVVMKVVIGCSGSGERDVFCRHVVCAICTW
jgi:hypothetical protein